MPRDVGNFPDEDKDGPDIGIRESKSLESRKDTCPHRVGTVPLPLLHPQPPTAALHVLPSRWLSWWEAPGTAQRGGAGQEKAVNLRVPPYLWKKAGKIQGKAEGRRGGQGAIRGDPVSAE